MANISLQVASKCYREEFSELFDDDYAPSNWVRYWLMRFVFRDKQETLEMKGYKRWVEISLEIDRA